MDHVFGDRRKQPQPSEARCQPDREVQPQVFAAGEARGCKHPQVLGACDEARAISLEPAPPEPEPCHQGDEKRRCQAGLTYVMLEPREITAEQVAERAKSHGPTHCAEGVIEHEAAVRHASRSRKHGSPGAQQRDEAADENRSEEHTSELQSPCNLVCRLLLEKKKSIHCLSAIAQRSPTWLNELSRPNLARLCGT